MAVVLRKLKDMAQPYLGQQVKNAMIAIPAEFNDLQRAAVKTAARIAGLCCLRLINRPIAASISAAASVSAFTRDQGVRTVLVCHVGGATTEATVLEIDVGVYDEMARIRDTSLGGNDFDERLMDHLIQKYEEKGVELSQDPQAMANLRIKSTMAKHHLSSEISANIDTAGLFANEEIFKISRDQFESMNEDHFQKILKLVQKVLEDAQISPKNIDDIILVGGSSNIPRIQSMFHDFFGKKTLPEVSSGLDEVALRGTAIQAHLISDSMPLCDLHLPEMNKIPYGIETAGGVMTPIIRRGTILPTRKAQNFSTVADGQDTVVIRLRHGLRPIASHNRLLVEFEVTGIAPAPQGTPQIEVSLELDDYENLIILAGNRDVGMKNISLPGVQLNYSEDDVERMMLEAEENYEQDERVKKMAEDYFGDNVLVAKAALASSEHSLRLKEQSDIADYVVNTSDDKNFRQSHDQGVADRHSEL
jgi:endoplasmic reticulum chaperone BiP